MRSPIGRKSFICETKKRTQEESKKLNKIVKCVQLPNFRSLLFLYGRLKNAYTLSLFRSYTLPPWFHFVIFLHTLATHHHHHHRGEIRSIFFPFVLSLFLPSCNIMYTHLIFPLPSIVLSTSLSINRTLLSNKNPIRNLSQIIKFII